MRPKLEVEPLSEPRWNKVERGLFERLDAEDDGREEPGSIRPTAKPRKAYLVYGAVAVAAAVVLFVGQGWMGRSSALGVSPARIVTGASESHLTYGDVTVDVAHDSTLVLSGDDEARRALADPRSRQRDEARSPCSARIVRRSRCKQARFSCASSGRASG